MAMPKTVNPLAEYLFWNSIRSGISARHGSHQVAQKFTSTTLPFRLSSVTSFPCRSLKVTTGSAGWLPLLSDLAAGLPLPLTELHPGNAAAAIAVARIKGRNLL